MKLSRNGFIRARNFIMNNARPLDQSLFRYHFENGSKEDVMEELSKFQNPDGGFGHGIEPDLRLSASSPFATSVGLQYYIEANGDAESDMVKMAIEYLVSTYDAENDFWPFTFLDVNDEAHAPWWHLEKIEPPKDDRWANPSAEIAGYLARYSHYVPKEILANVNRRVNAILNQSEDIVGSLYGFLCWHRVRNFFPEPIRSELVRKLGRTIDRIVPTLAENMGEIRIFWLVSDTNSLLLSHPEFAYRMLEKEIGLQAEDGGWWPTWKWMQYEEVWPIAEKEWAGRMTYACLRTLRALNLNNRLIEQFE